MLHTSLRAGVLVCIHPAWSKRLHLVLSAASMSSKRHESAMSIATSGKHHRLFLTWRVSASFLLL